MLAAGRVLRPKSGTESPAHARADYFPRRHMLGVGVGLQLEPDVNRLTRIYPWKWCVKLGESAPLTPSAGPSLVVWGFFAKNLAAAWRELPPRTFPGKGSHPFLR